VGTYTTLHSLSGYGHVMAT